MERKRRSTKSRAEKRRKMKEARTIQQWRRSKKRSWRGEVEEEA